MALVSGYINVIECWNGGGNISVKNKAIVRWINGWTLWILENVYYVSVKEMTWNCNHHEFIYEMEWNDDKDFCLKIKMSSFYILCVWREFSYINVAPIFLYTVEIDNDS